MELAPNREDRTVHGHMVRTDRYKYTVFNKSDRPEVLFDLKADPGEKANLAYQPAMKPVVADHPAKLVEWLKRIGDGFKPAV